MEATMSKAERQYHGKSRSAEYGIWIGMQRRCYDPKEPRFHLYGRMGVRVCDRWLGSFANFLADMGPRPSPQHSIDRWPDTNGHYAPDNCRWATPKQQVRGRRVAFKVAVDGENVSLADLCEEHGLVYQRVYERLKRGWPLDKAMSQASSFAARAVRPRRIPPGRVY
jgi:hypothetical protein